MILNNRRKKSLIHFITSFIPSKPLRRKVRNALINIYIERAYTLRELIFGKIKIYKSCPKIFELPEAPNPLVSIIVPVYNQYKYTLLCLWSILQNSGDIAYEIILADDNSNDETKDIGNKIKNLKIVRNKENLRFLKKLQQCSQSRQRKISSVFEQ